jgi:hypothetical protein
LNSPERESPRLTATPRAELSSRGSGFEPLTAHYRNPLETADALLDDIVREVKHPAAAVAEHGPGTGAAENHALIVAQQRRLAITLVFLAPDVFNLFVTRDLATVKPHEITADTIERSAAELLRCLGEINRGEYSAKLVRHRQPSRRARELARRGSGVGRAV